MSKVDTSTGNQGDEDIEEQEPAVDSELVDTILNAFLVVNTRIELLLDRDHCIGHSHFTGVRSDEDLHETWYTSIIPLIQEYFYNDWEKVKLVLGTCDEGRHKGFVTVSDASRAAVFDQGADWDVPPVHGIHVHEKGVAFRAVLRKTYGEHARAIRSALGLPGA